ncbi:MAG: gamma-glutamyltransferase [Terriglobia bacterium]
MHRVALLTVLLAASSLAAQESFEPSTARAPKGMVVAAEPFATEVGIEIFRRGGNAVDAAVAVAFALAVTYPQAGNLGGGGFMLIRMGDGTAVMVDYRETAPGAARPDLYLDAEGNLIPQASTEGWRAAAVPGTVAGLALALQTHGTLSLEDVLQPAIRLAEKGFPVSRRLAEDLREAAPRLSRDRESRRLFLRKGRYYQPGDTFKQKDLARTLKKIARGGAREFYQGTLARRLAEASHRGGGLITLEDLRSYRAKLRAPVRGSFRGYEVLAAAPPSSGGVALLETLNILEPLLGSEDKPEEPETIHVTVEALRRAFADRARYLADADFVPVPVAALTDKAYAGALGETINRQRASVSTELERPDPMRFQGGQPVAVTPAPPPRESENTTHFSVVDADGNAVAVSTTINSFFGNGITVPGLGFLLNNEMDDFASKPGAPNALFALVQSAANKIEPRKRPLSSMTPTIVARDGEAILVLGSPGGPRIISAVIEVLLNRLAFGDDLPLAVARPRFHHQWLPDTLYLEQGLFSQGQVAALRALGHSIEERGTVGQMNAIERNPASGEVLGVSDGRRRGAVRGY